jgi:glycerol-3-phosphate acyltransferase PlsY
MLIILCAVLGYLLGSIPFGLVLTRLAGTEDILKIGSKNPGATNVLRTGRKDLALLTVIFDATKAGIAAIIAYYVIPNDTIVICGYYTTANILASLITGFAAIVGHNFPVWLKFKGGKGVASSFGFILFTAPTVALLALATWLIVAFTTRYSSLSAIVAALLVPVYAYFYAYPIYTFFMIPVVLLLLVRHHANIARLIKGEESKISFKKKTK